MFFKLLVYVFLLRISHQSAGMIFTIKRLHAERNYSLALFGEDGPFICSEVNLPHNYLQNDNHVNKCLMQCLLQKVDLMHPSPFNLLINPPSPNKSIKENNSAFKISLK